MKSFAHKLLAFSFIFALATGCASVTDAGLDTSKDQQVEQQAPNPDNIQFGSDSDMQPILDKPE